MFRDHTQQPLDPLIGSGTTNLHLGWRGGEGSVVPNGAFLCFSLYNDSMLPLQYSQDVQAVFVHELLRSVVY